MTIKDMAAMALDCQDACNLSGVVHSWDRVVTALWDEARRQDKGTDWVNTHPINILFVDKLASLTHQYSHEVVMDAYRECAKLAEREK